MAQFTPSKKTIKDFNDGEEYLNRIDVVQADTVNNLVEGLLYAQENGGTTMLTEGREFGKTLNDNDYWLDVVGYGSTIPVRSAERIWVPIMSGDRQIIIQEEPPSLCLTNDVNGLVITQDGNKLEITESENNQLKIEG